MQLNDKGQMTFNVQLSSSDLAFISMVLEMYAVEMERERERIVLSRNENLLAFVDRDIRDAKRLVEKL
jgi:hypothetical protein